MGLGEGLGLDIRVRAAEGDRQGLVGGWGTRAVTEGADMAGLRVFTVLGWEPAADELARSRVEGADVEDLRFLEGLGREPAADKPSRFRVEGADVEDPRVLGVLGWKPAAGEPASWVGSSKAGA